MAKLIEFVNPDILPEEAEHALVRARYQAGLRARGIILSDAELDEKLTKSMAQNGMFEEKTLEYLRKNGELQPACPQLVVGMPPSLSQLEVEWAQGHSSERIKNLPQRGHPTTLEELGLLVR
jgi:hypothetical protein